MVERSRSTGQRVVADGGREAGDPRERGDRDRTGETRAKRARTDRDGSPGDSSSAPADEADDPVRIGALRRSEQFDAVVEATLFGWIGLGGMFAWRVTLSWLLQPLVGVGLSEPLLAPVVVTASFGLGAATVVAVYLRFFDHDLGFVDVSWLSTPEFGYTLGGLAGVTAVLEGSRRLLRFAGITELEFVIVERTADTPELLLVLVVLSVLVVGPGEELLYRNVVQKSLHGAVSRRSAIVIASVIFASIHVFAYSIALNTLSAVLATLSVLLLFSLGLGWLYSRTGNVVVPAAVHSLYSAGQLLLLYFRPALGG